MMQALTTSGVRRAVAALAAVATTLSLALPTAAQAQQVRIAKLNNFAFGTLTAPGSDVILADDVCTYSTAASQGYRVTVTGSGSGGAYTLSSGGNRLPLEVQWATAAGQRVGTALSPGVALAATTTNAVDSTCFLSSSLNASLIVVIRASQNGSALAGSYTGSLTIVLAPN